MDPVSRVPSPRLLLAAFVGGTCGCFLRETTIAFGVSSGLPPFAPRLLLNVLGAAGAGLVLARLGRFDAAGRPEGIDPRHRGAEHLLLAGFLGGLTTVAGFAFDAMRAAEAEAWGLLALLLAGDGAIGIAAAAAGLAFGLRSRRFTPPAA